MVDGGIASVALAGRGGMGRWRHAAAQKREKEKTLGLMPASPQVSQVSAREGRRTADMRSIVNAMYTLVAPQL